MKYWVNLRKPRPETGAVTLNMLVEFLESFDYEVLLRPSVNKSVCGISVSEEDRGLLVPQIGNAGTLHILEYDGGALELPSGAVSALLLVDGAEALAGEPTDRTKHYLDRSIAVLKTNDTDIAKLNNDILNYLMSIDKFTSSLAIATGSAGQYQGLVDVAEDFFNNFMVITDANNALVAYTKHIAPRDPVNLSLIRLKFHSEEQLSHEKSDGYLSEKITKQRGIQVYPADDMFPYCLMTAPIRVNGVFSSYVVMTCEEKEITSGTLDAFGIFISYCERVARRKTDASPSRSSFAQGFLSKLISQRDLDPVFVEQQAKRLSLPTQGFFALAQIKWDEGFKSQIDYFTDDINRDRSFFRIALRINGDVFCLLCSSEKAMLRGNLETLASTYPTSIAYRIYHSDPFQELSNLYFAYKSLASIEKYEKVIDVHRSWSKERNKRSISFQDAFSFYWNDPFRDSEIQDFTLSHMVTNLIAANDQEKHTDDLSLLLAYLTNERKAKAVADQCHLHRNGVLYRIKRIQEAYDMDLDNYLTREYVQSCIRVKLALEGNSPSLLSGALIQRNPNETDSEQGESKDGK